MMLVFGGCYTNTTTPDGTVNTVCNNNKCESDVQLDDGRILHCLRISGGISCDWANAKKP